MTSTEADRPAQLLDELLEEFDCVSGTIHRLEDGHLELVAHEAIPDPVFDRIVSIPVGKGMAGIAAERREPVQVCNVQEGDSDVVESGARETGVEGAIAAPIFGPDDTLEGVVGIAKAEEYEFSSEERDQLLAAGTRIAEHL